MCVLLLCLFVVSVSQLKIEFWFWIWFSFHPKEEELKKKQKREFSSSGEQPFLECNSNCFIVSQMWNSNNFRNFEISTQIIWSFFLIWAAPPAFIFNKPINFLYFQSVLISNLVWFIVKTQPVLISWQHSHKNGSVAQVEDLRDHVFFTFFSGTIVDWLVRRLLVIIFPLNCAGLISWLSLECRSQNRWNTATGTTKNGLRSTHGASKRLPDAFRVGCANLQLCPGATLTHALYKVWHSGVIKSQQWKLNYWPSISWISFLLGLKDTFEISLSTYFSSTHLHLKSSIK